jgi:leucine-rich repeat-containing G protein-coupled receptor 8
MLQDGNTLWQGGASAHSMRWWHHNYNSSLYPDILLNSAYYMPHSMVFYKPLLSRKFSLSALTAAKKEPANTALSAQKACTLLVAYSANQEPLWLPVSCSERLSIPYVCQKTTTSSSFTELQKSLDVQCPQEYQLFEGACYKLYSVPTDNDIWADFVCGQDGAKVMTDRGGLKPLFRMWNYDKDVHGTIWGLHKGETSAHVLCVSNITSIARKCSSGFFECADNSCILNLYVCDGHADCQEAEDEQECYNHEPTMATSFFYSCPSHYGSNISVSLLCNGREDCDQGQDEDKALCANHAFCSANQIRCDGVVDCLDGRDEDGCDYCAGFNCLGSACINVGNLHISPGWCRPSVFGVPSDVCSIAGRDLAPCSTEDAHCFPRSQACLLQHDRWGGVLHCPTGAHLVNCEKVECPQRFKCHRSYCLQMNKVCDGTKDCVNGEDESFCNDEERCAGLVRCRLSSLCLTQEQVCDGHSDCPYGDDEELCTSSWCPEGCSCTAHVLHCPHRWMYYLPLTVPPNLVSLQLTGNLISPYGYGKILKRFQSLLFLDMSYNIIIMMPRPNVYSPVLRLSLEGNKLHYLTDRAFAGMPYLQHLNLKGNYLGWISTHAFSQMHSLPELVLTGLNIVHMAPYCIADMPSLLSVNVSSNKIRYLLGNVFSGARRLQVIDLTNNPLIYIDASITAGAWYLENIYMPEFKLCCLLQESISERISCFPETDPTNVFSTCEDLLSYPILRGSIWIFGVSGILVNLFSVVWRRHTQKHSPFSLLVQHLGGADCLMGLYLLMIGAADAKYRNKYYLQEEDWRKSPHCKIAGFTSMLSCEMSVFLLVVITIDRVMAAGLGRKGIGRKTVRSVLMCGWLVWITLSTLPIVGMSYFGGHEYIKHGTCYLFNLSEGKTKGWEFTTAIFVTFNSFCVFFMIVGYSFVFISIQCKTGEMTPTKALARRLSAVIATNCVCWIPPIACGVVALSGHTVHPEIITWISVLVLPINSTVNPFLYTFSISRSVRCHKQRDQRDSEEGEGIQQDVLNEEPEPSTSAEAHVAHAGARPKTTVFKVSDTLI